MKKRIARCSRYPKVLGKYQGNVTQKTMRASGQPRRLITVDGTKTFVTTYGAKARLKDRPNPNLLFQGNEIE